MAVTTTYSWGTGNMVVYNSGKLVYLDNAGNVTSEETISLSENEVEIDTIVSGWIAKAKRLKRPITASIDRVVSRPFSRTPSQFGFDYSKLPSRNSKRHSRFSRK